TWTLQNVQGYKYETNAPGYRHSLPHMYVFIKDFQAEGKKIDVLDDTQRLYSYYRNFVGNINRVEDPELKKLSVALTAGAASESEKVKRIFYWVKDNIKYIAFENGYEGFIPRESALVYERKFGDCKDMAALICSMAGYAGIDKVKLCWIGTREIPYTYSELATPAVDNHMIAVYDDNNTYTFLDATDRETRYGIPTAFIQGKEALIGLGDQYKIVTVPTVLPDENTGRQKIELKLDGEKLSGSGSLGYSGFGRSHILMQIGDAKSKTRFEMIKSLLLKGSNKFNLLDFKETNLSNRDQPYQVDYTFDLDNYAVKVDKDTYLALVMDKPFEKMQLEADRTSPVEFDYLTADDITYDLLLPKGTTVKSLPKNFRLDNDLMQASLDYSATAEKISLRMIIKLRKLMLFPQDFKRWNQTVACLRENYSETLILTEK
ncbi:MAG: transglutaminase domain-containing protein, partial [Chitinophagaceae bacterium]